MLLLTYEGGGCRNTHAETSIHTEKTNKAKGVMQTVSGEKDVAFIRLFVMCLAVIDKCVRL